MPSHFNFAQTFYVDPALVQNAYQIQLSKVALFFKNRPAITGNKSGIYAPGVEIRIAPTQQGVPILQLATPPFRQEYTQIIPSSTSLSPTVFDLGALVTVKAGKEYAIIIKFDGDEDYELWRNTQGELLLDSNGTITTTVSQGAPGTYIGKLYSYISPTYETGQAIDNATIDSGSMVPSISEQQPLDQTEAALEYLLASWRPINNSDLKFSVEIARYSHNGFPVMGNTALLDSDEVSYQLSDNITMLSNNVLEMISPAYPMEYVKYDKKLSQTENIMYGDYVYEHQSFYPGGRANSACLTVSVAESNVIVTCPTNYTLHDSTAFDWSKMFALDGNLREYLVIVSLNHDGANAHRVNVRRAKVIYTANDYTSNNILIVHEPVTFTNSAALVFKSPVGRIYSKSRPYISGFSTDLIVLADSNANTSCRFVNNYISNVTINQIGAGYSNSDSIRITGFENVVSELMGGYIATANIQTYANGSIQFVWISNTGAGFVNTSSIAYSVINSTAGASAGTGANLTFTTNTVLYTQFGGMNTYFANAKIMNFESQTVTPALNIKNPPGTVYSIKYKSLYKSANTSNTISGRKYYIDTTESEVETEVKNGVMHYFASNKHPVILSRSNQFVTGYANGFIPNSSIIGDFTSNTAVLIVDMYSNNDFSSISMSPTGLLTFYSRYSINDDYTLENTNYGNAFAKHVTTKISFANGQFAEDLIVYLSAYRPQGTDIKVLARMHNSHDSEAFDDKDWTLLEHTDGVGVFSSLTNQSDRVEMTYTLPLYPNSNPTVNTSTLSANLTLSGVVATELNNTSIVGIGTTFTSNLAAGDLIRLYQPLFANADYMVAVVNTITNNTLLTLNDPVTNNSLVASGMKIDKISYPKQAFRNTINDNVVRYYTTSKVAFDTFDTMQIKVVMLSPDDYIVPKIDDIRAIGVTS